MSKGKLPLAVEGGIGQCSRAGFRFSETYCTDYRQLKRISVSDIFLFQHLPPPPPFRHKLYFLEFNKGTIMVLYYTVGTYAAYYVTNFISAALQGRAVF